MGSSSMDSSSMDSSSMGSSSSSSSSGGDGGGYSSGSGGDNDSRYHPGGGEYGGCKYSGEWGDCDPFKMIKIKEERLVSGGASCQDRKNVTKACSRDDFPPGTVWLLKEHKLCVAELQKLKSMIDDLHRYIDLIHQRGQALFNAYNELRKRLMDVRREISIIGRRNHDAEQTIKRLRFEMEDWKSKSNKMEMDLNELKAQYSEMEKKVVAVKEKNKGLVTQKTELSETQVRLTSKLDELELENRKLKSDLLEAERYRVEFKEVADLVAVFKKKIADVNRDIKKTKEDLNKARMEGVVPRPRKQKPKFNKDTKVNLDMSMWIVHNISKEEQEEYYPKLELKPYEVQYVPAPSTYKPPSTTPAYSEAPAYSEQPAYSEAPSYSEAPGYSEQPASEQPAAPEENKY